MRVGMLLLSLVLLGSLMGCADHVPVVTEIPSPAEANSGQPNLVAGPGQMAYLTWLENLAGSTRRLRFAIWNGNAWSESRTIAESSNLLMNWADFPSLIVLDDGSLAAHWLTRTPE